MRAIARNEKIAAPALQRCSLLFIGICFVIIIVGEAMVLFFSMGWLVGAWSIGYDVLMCLPVTATKLNLDFC